MPLHEPQDDPAPDRRTTALKAVSTALMGIEKEQHGRGPVAARSHWAGPDVLVCVLEDALTTAERSLLAVGEGARVEALRAVLHRATAGRRCHGVEAVTGRAVRGCTTGMDADADGLVTQVFVMHPAAERRAA